ncbi:MAG: hypothetical protein BWX88_04300 [Planctomycetes bacterium ADurb.Bin126]|nr:MAG: hypothetical protein BWX88_04300 [Planctomycetes bacterium ADurb.Bin126]
MNSQVQSPGAGAVAFPSPFESPPTLSSRMDVNAIGWTTEPCARSVPPVWTVIPQSASNLTIAPGLIVRVTPLGTVTLAVTWWRVEPPHAWLPGSTPLCVVVR